MVAVMAKFLIRILTYLFGLLVVLALLGAGVFVLARPQIDEFVTAEIKKRGLGVNNWDLGLNGRANLHEAHMTLPGGVDLKATLISARPPLSGFPGVATLYDVRLERGDVRLFIPEVEISGISQNGQDSEVTQPILRLLNRFDIGRITADGIRLNIGGGDDSIKLGNIMLEAVNKGRIGRLQLGALDGQLDKITQQASKGSVRIGALDVREIDLAASINILSQPASSADHVGVPLVGAVHLQDLTFDGKIDDKPLVMNLGRFESDDFSLQSSETIALDVVRDFLMEQGEEVREADKKQAQDKLLSLLDMLYHIDVLLTDMDLSVPGAKVQFHSLSLRSDDWNLLLPEQVDVKLEGLVVEMLNLPDDVASLITAIGYNRIEASAAIAAQFDKESQSVDVKDMSFTASNMGDFFLGFQLDHVDMRPLMRDDENLTVWLQRLRLRDFNLGIRDRGAITNFVTIISGIGGVEKEEISQGLEDMARSTPSILFEDEALADSATDALVALLRQSGLLRLHVSSKTEAGLELKQLMVDDVDWRAILDLADIRFSHEESVIDPKGG